MLLFLCECKTSVKKVESVVFAATGKASKKVERKHSVHVKANTTADERPQCEM